MKEKKRCLLACDYDGTIFYHDGTGFHPEDLEAIRRFQQEGGILGLNTGRPIITIGLDPEESIPLETNGIRFDFYGGCSGAQLADHNRELISVQTFPYPLALEIEKRMGEHLIFASTRDRFFGRPAGHFPALIEAFDSVFDLPQESLCHLALLFASRKEAQEAVQELKESGLPLEFHQNLDSVDIGPAHVSKATLLEEAAACFGIGMDHVYAIGDGLNDLPALQHAKIGFALTSGDPQLQHYPVQMVSSLAEAIAAIERQENLNSPDPERKNPFADQKNGDVSQEES